ncbi:MAG: hypothetical protein ACR2ND_05845 [Solirubrobacteraceae bacterium]
MSDSRIVLRELGQSLAFSFEDMMRYHGPGSPGGVAHAFKVFERGLPLLGASGSLERRELSVRTAFAGPGARDAIELACRAVSDGRYAVDAGLGRPERGVALERFVFELSYRGESRTLVLRDDGYVSEEFIALAREPARSEPQELLLRRMKREMAERVMSARAADVYDVG